ncbi:MAG TPA: hypothetical protein VGG71_13735 [Chitinophagaceae bacterium]|jgi:hypothetical protein
MNTNLFNEIVPRNIKGKSTSLEESTTAGTREEALDTFKRACKRLLNVKIWHELIGFGSGKFELTAANGNEMHTLAEIGNFFKIGMPGPGTTSGDGYDWVKVEKIIVNSNSEGEEESFGMRVRACNSANKHVPPAAYNPYKKWFIVRAAAIITAITVSVF